MADLFNITHDAGNLNEYDSTVIDGGNLSATVPAALAGTAYGLNCFITGSTNSMYGQVDQGDPGTSDIRIRFYIDINSLAMANNDRFYVLVVGITIVTIDLWNNGGTYTLGAIWYDDNGWIANSWAAVTDDVHYVEIHIQKAATAGSNDGAYEWWIDGVSKGTQANVDIFNSFEGITRLRIGAPGNLDGGTSGTLYIDEFRANDDGGEIGPIIPLAAMGLAWDGRTLWYCGSDTDLICQIDCTGQVIQSFASPSTSPYGLTFDGKTLWHCDSDTALIYQIDHTGQVIRSFATPGQSPGDLAWDGHSLWHCDSSAGLIYQIDPSGQVINSFASPGSEPSGLTWDGYTLWHCDLGTDLIYQITSDGVILQSFASPGSEPRSLTWDGRTLWHCDSNTKLIYQIYVN